MTKCTPVSESNRIESIDVLRGFALLGILVININSFGMPWATVDANPVSYGDMSGCNILVWFISTLFFKIKMMNIFAMLFGAGLVLMTSRMDQGGASSWKIYYRRSLILLFFGAIHSYLIWDGDILLVYAVCGFIIFWFRKLSAKWLIMIVILIICARFGMMTGKIAGFDNLTQEELNRMRDSWNCADSVKTELTQYRGGFIQNLLYRIKSSSSWHMSIFTGFGLLQFLQMMFLGMGLYKLDIFSAVRSYRFYLIMIIIGFLTGLSMTGYGVFCLVNSNWDAVVGRSIYKPLLYFSSLFISLGWIGLVMMACKGGCCRWLLRCYAAAGRMALSNYLMHSFICTFIFYGFGLGYYGYLERWELIVVVASIWGLQLLISPIWLRYFRFGPFEWLWRSLTYLSFPPFRRRKV